MASKDELAALRAQVRARHRAAVQKVSRLRSRGVELGGTEYDPRRDLGLVKRYNTTQLRAYLNRLDSFVDRSNAFVGLRGNVPAPARLWREYKREERAYKRAGEADFNAVKDVVLPSGESTVADRLTRLSQRAAGQAVDTPYNVIERESRNITSIDALKKLTEDMRRRNQKEFLPAKIAEAREQFNDMADAIGDPGLKDEIAELSDYQFNVLWNYSAFATDASLEYERLKMAKAGKNPRLAASLEAENSNESIIRESIKWAKLIPENKR